VPDHYGVPVRGIQCTRITYAQYCHMYARIIASPANCSSSPRITPKLYPPHNQTDSKYAIEGLTKHLTKWEDQGWIEIKNKEWFKHAAYLLRTHLAPTSFQWIKGHNGNSGNEGSDTLAKQGVEKETPNPLCLEIPACFNVQGAKLTALS
jgi:RNase H